MVCKMFLLALLKLLVRDDIKRLFSANSCRVRYTSFDAAKSGRFTSAFSFRKGSFSNSVNEFVGQTPSNSTSFSLKGSLRSLESEYEKSIISLSCWSISQNKVKIKQKQTQVAQTQFIYLNKQLFNGYQGHAFSYISSQRFMALGSSFCAAKW